MRYALLLTTTVLLVTACATPTPSARVANATGMPTMRAVPDLTRWTAYRTFHFDPMAIDVSPSDVAKIKEIVAHLSTNPSLDVGIDGTLTVAGTSDADRRLGIRRATAVRRALMDTGVGVASYRILNGAVANPDQRHAGQVQVLVGPRTGSLNAGL